MKLSQFIMWLMRPCSSKPLACFRVGLGFILIIQAFESSRDFGNLFLNPNLVDFHAVSKGVETWSPINAAFVALRYFHLPEWKASAMLFSLYVFALFMLMVGWKTRVFGVISWLLHSAFLMSNPYAGYGADGLTRIGLFYCVVMPTGQWLSMDRAGKSRRASKSSSAKISIRVLQIHLCIIYATSGIIKAFGLQWRNGEALWRALNREDLALFDFSFLASMPHLALALSWATLAIECGYPIFVWYSTTRTIWLALVVTLHVGIGFSLGLYYFSALMILFSLCAFGWTNSKIDGAPPCPTLNDACPT